MKKKFVTLLFFITFLPIFAQNKMVLQNKELIKIYTKDDNSFSLCDNINLVRDLLGSPNKINVESTFTGDKDCFNLVSIYYDGISLYHYKGFDEIIGIKIDNDSFCITDAKLCIDKSIVDNILETYKELPIARNMIRKGDNDITYKTLAFKTTEYLYGPLLMIYFDFDIETDKCIAIKLTCTEE